MADDHHDAEHVSPEGVGPAEESPAQDVPADIAAKIDHGVNRSLEAFEEKLKYDGSKQQTVDRLYNELQGYRADLVAQAARPFIFGMIRHHTEIGKLATAIRGAPAEEMELASRLCAAASAHGLTRTLLRGLALSMVAAHGAGRKEQALARVAEFLRLTRDVDYVRPLVRHREVSRAVLRRLLDTDPDTDLRLAAESMLADVDEPAPATSGFFSWREVEVLVQVGRGLGNREIASRLGLTDEGVRYHLKNIYRKTGASKRTDAVRYAQSLGVLS